MDVRPNGPFAPLGRVGRDKPVPYEARLERTDGFGTGPVGATLVVARPECVDKSETGRDKPVPYGARVERTDGLGTGRVGALLRCLPPRPWKRLLLRPNLVQRVRLEDLAILHHPNQVLGSSQVLHRVAGQHHHVR